MSEHDRFGGSLGATGGQPADQPAGQSYGIPGPSMPGQAPQGQFGAVPPPPPPFGAAAIYAQPSYAPAPRRGLPVWAIVAICVPVALVAVGVLAAIAIPVLVNQRSAPVMPATLGGLSVATDPTMTQGVADVRKELTTKNAGHKVDAAGYGSTDAGYLLMGLNVRIDSAREFRGVGATSAPTMFGDVQCAVGANRISLCLHTEFRGTVEVLRLGDTDLSALAAATDEAWAAQPFGD
jgi:hypothetical protein